MEAKEKAKELFDKFCDVIPIEANFSDSVEEANRKIIADHLASKKCALIAVDEKLRLFYRLCSSDKQFWTSDENDVFKELINEKSELEKL